MTAIFQIVSAIYICRDIVPFTLNTFEISLSRCPGPNSRSRDNFAIRVAKYYRDYRDLKAQQVTRRALAEIIRKLAGLFAFNSRERFICRRGIDRWPRAYASLITTGKRGSINGVGFK